LLLVKQVDTMSLDTDFEKRKYVKPELLNDDSSLSGPRLAEDSVHNC